MCSATILFGCPSKFSFRLGILKHVSASVTVGRGGLAGVARTSEFFVFGWLSSGKAVQLFYWVCYEPGAFLSLLVCVADVSSGKGTLLYVCVCVCVRARACACVRVCARVCVFSHWQSVYFDQCSLEPCYNTMVVPNSTFVCNLTSFKVCKYVHHRTIKINHQPDATISQFIILTFIYSSTCFGRFPPIIRSSMTAVAASGFTLVSWWQSCCVRGRAGPIRR